MLGFLCGRLDTTSHRHFAVQLTVALEHPFSLELAGQPPRDRMSAVIPADVAHCFVSFSGDHLFLLINPLSQLGLRMDARAAGRLPDAELPETLVEQIRSEAVGISEAPTDEGYERVASLVRRWSTELPRRRLDHRVRKAIDAMQRSDANLTTVAHEVGFADSAHLARTFKEMFGIPPSAVR